MDKICTGCQKTLPLSFFYGDKNKKDKHNSHCKDCHKKNTREGYYRLRQEAYDRYGGAQCVNCGEDFFEVLALDHIEGGGRKENIETGISGARFVYNLRQRGWPPGFQVLCHICNALKYRYPNAYILRKNCNLPSKLILPTSQN